ncbi:MAG: glutathione S-transferase family protein [Rickettsiales bacterium]|nr:glutathione S-transferase family protein [Rickettsiales bacterium]
MLTIYGYPLSSPANKVLYTANALGLDYVFKLVDLRAGDQKKEAFLKLNPVGKVPAMEDDGFSLFESNAICKYLAQKHGKLYPQGDLEAEAKANQWLDFISLHLSNNFGKVMFNRLLAPMIGIDVDQNSLNEGLKFLADQIPVVEKHLQENTYMLGDELSIVDLALLSVFDPAEAVKLSLNDYPALKEWRSKLQKEEFFTKVHTHFGEGLLDRAA